MKGRTVVVLVDIPLGQERNRNLYGLARDGTFKWRVEAPSDKEGHTTPFSDIYMDKKGRVWGRTVGGRLFQIDVETGALTSE